MCIRLRAMRGMPNDGAAVAVRPRTHWRRGGAVALESDGLRVAECALLRAAASAALRAANAKA